MSDDKIEYQCYICPWCFNDHSNLLCKTEDVKQRVENLQKELDAASQLILDLRAEERVAKEDCNAAVIKIMKLEEEIKEYRSALKLIKANSCWTCYQYSGVFEPESSKEIAEKALNKWERK